MYKENYIKVTDISIFLLFILNLLDLYCTYMGLTIGYIQEANPLMRQLYDFAPTVFILAKITIPTILLLIIQHYYCSYSINDLVQKLLNTVIVIYLYTVLLHINIIFNWLVDI